MSVVWVVFLPLELALVAYGNEPVQVERSIKSPLHVAERSTDTLATRLSLDADGYAGIKSATDALLTDFALSENRTVELDLSRVEIFADNASIVLGTPDGDLPLPRPEVVLLSGQVVGHPGSLAFLSLSPHGTNGLIQLDDELHVISGARDLPGVNARVYNLTDLPPGAIQWADFKCGLDQLMSGGKVPILETAGPAGDAVDPGMAASGGDVARVTDMAIETDWEFTGSLFGGNTDASGAYAATLIAAISEIYIRDVSTHLQISYLRLWSNSSDPWSGSDTSAQLNQFVSYWRSNMGWVSRDVAHFLSGRGLGGGIAYLNALCSNSWGYAVSANLDGYFPYPLQDNHSANWDVFVVAHELGHNFGAPHTHDMWPRVDNCAGGDCSVTPNATIMSYCHLCPGGMTNILLRFHARSINEEILPYITGLSCIVASGPPVILIQPSDVGACDGRTTVISFSATGQHPLSFAWRKDGQLIPGETLPSLTFDPVSAADAGVYEATVTNGLGSVVSDPATLSILECGPADAAAAGCRRLAISPEPGLTAMVAFLVTSPDYSCLSRYVDTDGKLVSNAVFQPANQWGTTEVTGVEIVPATDYEVWADYGSPGSPSLSAPTLVPSPPWGDVVSHWNGTEWLPADGVVDFSDISAQVDRFKNRPTAPPLSWCDIYPATPDGLMNFNDVSATVDGFRGSIYPFAGPCP